MLYPILFYILLFELELGVISIGIVYSIDQVLRLFLLMYIINRYKSTESQIFKTSNIVFSEFLLAVKEHLYIV